MGRVQDPPEGAAPEGTFEWMAEFADWYDDTPQKKGISKFLVRLEVDEGAEVKIYARYDSLGRLGPGGPAGGQCQTELYPPHRAPAGGPLQTEIRGDRRVPDLLFWRGSSTRAPRSDPQAEDNSDQRRETKCHPTPTTTSFSAANQAGHLQEFSQADLDTAQRYPEFGMSILGLKAGNIHKATTPEAKLLANEAANQLRSSYGGYTGGPKGADYVSVGKIPQPDRQRAGPDQQLRQLRLRAGGPHLHQQYAEQQRALLDAILNREDFSWSQGHGPAVRAVPKELPPGGRPGNSGRAGSGGGGKRRPAFHGGGDGSHPRPGTTTPPSSTTSFPRCTSRPTTSTWTSTT